MICNSKGIINGIILKQFGKFGQQFYRDIPTYSLPISISDYPNETRTFSLIMHDIDAIPICGFDWIHWSVANLTRSFLNENESINPNGFIQGVNSRASKLLPDSFSDSEATIYGGCRPPNAPHEYEIKVYALDIQLDLQNGFFVNDLLKKIKGHILDETQLHGIYYHDSSLFT